MYVSMVCMYVSMFVVGSCIEMLSVLLCRDMHCADCVLVIKAVFTLLAYVFTKRVDT